MEGLSCSCYCPSLSIVFLFTVISNLLPSFVLLYTLCSLLAGKVFDLSKKKRRKKKVDKCPLIGSLSVACVQLGPRKPSVVRSSGVSAIQGLLKY